MQAIIYRLSFYNTEVLTKGGSGRGPLFLITRNRKRKKEKGTLVKQDTLQTFPLSLPPAQLIPKHTATCQAAYSDVLQPNTVNGWDLCSKCSFKILTTSIIMLTVQTTNFNNKAPCTLHSAFMCSA
jgi:hypothetical protein